MPVAIAEELTDAHSTRFVRVLGEALVLLKDRSGRVGLLADHCPHRGCSLLYGRPEERGIACADHGWLFDTDGNCLECPAEPVGSMFHLTVKHRAHPVQKYVSLHWAYLGPLPAPVIPHYDVRARKDGTRRIHVQPQLDWNWMQAMENSVDPAHNQNLHQRLTLPGDLPDREVEPTVPPSTTRGFIDDTAGFEFYELPYGGIMKKRMFRNGMVDQHLILFPNVLRQGNVTQIRVPIDDTHTWIVFVSFVPTPDGSLAENEGDPPIRNVQSYEDPPQALHPNPRFDMRAGQHQDHMVWETQGPVADRSIEHLTTSDRGVIMYRDLLSREIARVERGEDPIGVFRDPDHSIMETNLDEALRAPRMRDPRRNPSLLATCARESVRAAESRIAPGSRSNP